MDRNADLLPWILGGVSMAAVAIAIAIGSSNRTAPNLTAHALPDAVAIDTPSMTALPATPTASGTPTMPATPPLPAPAVMAAQIQPASPPMIPSGQIWECTTNGQRTFSSNPCGDKSSIREVSPINIMSSAPILPSARSGYNEPESNYSADYPYPAQEAADSSNTVLVGIPYFVRARPERTHRPYKHDRGPSTRRIY